MSNIQCPSVQVSIPSQSSTAISDRHLNWVTALTWQNTCFTYRASTGAQRLILSPSPRSGVSPELYTTFGRCAHLLASSDMVDFPTPIGGNIMDGNIGRKFQSRRGFRPSYGFQFLPPSFSPFTFSPFLQSLGIISSVTNGIS